MNHKNNLSLFLASTMVSGMFSAAVNAKAYKFTENKGNLSVYTVSTADGKNIISGEGKENIEFSLSATGTKSQKVAFGVNSDYADTASGDLKAVDKDLISSLQKSASEATDALNAAAAKGAAADNNISIQYAKAFRNAVEVMAKIRGEVKNAANSTELDSVVRRLTVAVSKAYMAAGYGVAEVTKNDFKFSDLPNGLEDQPNLDSATLCNLSHGTTVQAGAATLPVSLGICVGDVITTGFADSAKKYQVLGTPAHDWATAEHLEAANAANVAKDNAVRIDDSFFVIGTAGVAGLVQAGANIDTNARTGNATSPAAANTFLRDRAINATSTFGGNVGGHGGNGTRLLANGKTIIQQLQEFNQAMKDYYMARAKDFLQNVSDVPKGSVEASWLGAGSPSGKNLNNAEDYGVTIALKKGGDAVAVRKHIYSRVALGGENGAAVTPIIVEFVSKAVEKDTAVEGTLKIRSAGATQKIKVEGVVHKSEENAYLAEQDDDDSEAEVIWDTSIDNEDENMPQSFMRVGQQNDAKKTGKEDEKELPIKMQIKCCPDQCNII